MSAVLSTIRRLLLSGGLLFVVASHSPTFAQTGAQMARAEATQVHRALSEDPLIDQNLVASLPAVAAAAGFEAGAAADSPALDTDQHIAAIGPGPAMRPLVNQLNAIWPTAGEITTYFGEVSRLAPRGHSGLDIAGPEGTLIVAADVGEVLRAYWNGDGYGGLIVIAHPSGYETWYGHLARFDVEPGDQVTRGQHIGLMGSTGMSTGAHLHFEVRQDGQLCDPLTFLKEASLKPASL